MMQQKKSLESLSEMEIKALIEEHNSGKDIDYDIKHLYGELLFRDMLAQWDEDEVKQKDEGCGHDQNEDYYDKEE